MSYIYFDNSASTPVAPEVRDEMVKYLGVDGAYANPSSVHMFGVEASDAVEAARSGVAKYFNCQPKEVIFTASGSESDSLAILGMVRGVQRKRGISGGHIITSTIEHPAVLEVFDALKADGMDVTFLPVNADGQVTLASFENALKSDTIFASVMYVNNETGVIQPVQGMARACRDAGVVFHTDAVQAAGKLPLDVQALGVDLLTLSGHKVYAPKGVSALYVREQLMDTLEPVIRGGGHEFGKRSGTVAVHQVVALAKACELLQERHASDNKHIALLRETFETKISAALDNVLINGAKSDRVSSVSSVTFRHIDSEALLVLTGEVCSSPGSACAGDDGLSHVLEAMGVDPIDIRASLRFSFGRYNTMDEVERAVAMIVPAVTRLREFSPLA